MDVKLGGSMRYLPLGPASATRSRSGVFGVLLSQATPPRIPQLSGLGSGPLGENRPFQSGDTPERRLERLAKARRASAAYRSRK